MFNSVRVAETNWSIRTVGTSVLLLVGLGLTSYGSYMHFTIATQLEAGHCDGCTPWHPLLILSPLVAGLVCGLIAGYLFYQR